MAKELSEKGIDALEKHPLRGMNPFFDSYVDWMIRTTTEKSMDHAVPPFSVLTNQYAYKQPTGELYGVGRDEATRAMAEILWGMKDYSAEQAAKANSYPVKFITSTDDSKYVPDSSVEGMRESLGEAHEYELVEGDHLYPEKRPEAFATKVIEFFSRQLN